MTARLLLGLFGLFLTAVPAAAQHAWPASYPEGPVWVGETLYWGEMSADKVMAWNGGTPSPVFERNGCGPTAIAQYREDDFIVLCHLEGALAHVNKDFQLLRMIRATADGLKLRDPNDAVADGEGGVWFSDPGRFQKSAGAEGAIYYLAPDGTLTRHVTGLFYGNGVWLDRSGKRLLVSEHLARRVLAYPLTRNGLGEPEQLFHVDDFGLPAPRYDHSGPDGLEIGPNGTLWVAEYGTARLLGWQADAGLVAAMAVDAQFITNIAFGPNGLVAVTGAKDNRTWPLPGAVWVFETQLLEGMIQK